MSSEGEHLEIKTPRGAIITVPTKDGKKLKAQLVWNASRIQKERKKDFLSAQKSVDRNVLRFSDRFVPLDTGMLKKSGTLGTVIGSGEVHYIAPYSRKQYYHGRKPGTSRTGADRGRYWFERMKSAHLKDIVAAAKKSGGGK